MLLASIKGAVATASIVTITVGTLPHPPHCTELQSPCGGGELLHYAPLMTEGSLSNTHTDCKLGGGNEFPKHWSGCQVHDADQLVYNEAKELASVGDVAGLVALGEELPEHVRYNADRNAVQVYSCSGESVVSTLSVPEPLISAAVLLE